ILLVVQDDKVTCDDDNDNDNLIEKLYNNVEMLNFQNVIDLEKYINYSKEKNVSGILSDQEIINQITYPDPETAEDNEESDKKDDNIELSQVSYKEASDAVHLLELYLMQQDLSDVAHTEYDIALSKLSGLVRKF
ncbi:13817_t:CDS:1, partial [Racocetra persica]